MVKEDEFELVPEGKFAKMENKLNEIYTSPVIKSKTAKELSDNIQVSNDSIKELLTILHKIAENNKFEETEEKIISNQLKPFIRSIKNIKEQNETIANGMVNIIDRLNDLQDDILEIKNNMYPTSSPIENPNLPPMTGGPTPPQNSISTPPQMNIPTTTPLNSPLPVNSSSIPPPLLGAKSVGGIPPMDKGGMKKKGFFK